MYSAGDETSFIVGMRTRASYLTRQLEQYVDYAHSGPEKWRDAYAEQVRRKSEAERTVALIEAHDFDRERLFRALVERAPEL